MLQPLNRYEGHHKIGKIKEGNAQIILITNKSIPALEKEIPLVNKKIAPKNNNSVRKKKGRTIRL